MKAGAVVVAWNSAGHIGPCLDALRRHAPSMPVVVVDNASSDPTVSEVRRFSAVVLVENSSNKGFASAVNQGIGMLAECELVLLLNPDAVVRTSLAAMRKEFEDPRTGACGGRLEDESGNSQKGFEIRRFPTPAALAFEALGLNRIWPGNPVNRRYRCLDVDTSAACGAEQPAGAFLMIRRMAWQQLGGFDEGYWPVWFEDVDFMKRLAAGGWRIRYTPGSAAAHAGGHSVGRMRGADRDLAWYGSLLRYVCRHFSLAGRAAVCWAVFASAVPRAAIKAVRGLSFRPFTVCAKVMRLSIAASLSGRTAWPEGTPREKVLPSPLHECAKLVNSGDRSPH